MTETSISVTEAARNFADCVNRAKYQGATFVLLKNGQPVARLMPAERSRICTGLDLSAALSRVSLSDEEKMAWRNDIETGSATLTPPVNPWS
jgi:prevent-host-death family protein